MDAFDLLFTRGPAAARIDPEPVLRDSGQIVRELADLLRGERRRFAPRSGHPVAMMLDEWISRLEEFAAHPVPPMPD